MEQEYFIPDKNDMVFGYQCEVQLNPGSWTRFKLNYADAIVDLFKWLDNGKLRVPYLIKEQIEAEGWEYMGFNQSRSVFRNKRDEFYQIEVDFNEHSVDISYAGEDGTRMNCPCINTFRFIFSKLIIIK